MHLVFNIIGTLVFMSLNATKPITMLVTHLDPNDVSKNKLLIHIHYLML